MLFNTRNPHGGDLYSRPLRADFSANTNPLGTPAAVIEAVKASLDRLDKYPDPHCRTLVKAIAAFEGVPRDYILCGGGAAELIFSYCAALKPKRALELAPTFSEYSAALASVGCEVCRYPLHADNGFTLTSEYLDTLHAERWDAVFLCNPNNPTGQLIPPELMVRIVETCRERGIRLFVDECFLDLTDEGDAYSVKGMLDDHPEIFILKAFTKSYGMAGLRLGYCLCSDTALLTAMGQIVQPWNVSTPAQAAGTAALSDPDWLVRTRELIRVERAWLAGELRVLGIEVYPSRANYLLLHGPDTLYAQLMEQGIQIRDCSNYHNLAKGWYRIAVKRHEENALLIDAVKAIRERG